MYLTSISTGVSKAKGFIEPIFLMASAAPFLIIARALTGWMHLAEVLETASFTATVTMSELRASASLVTARSPATKMRGTP